MEEILGKEMKEEYFNAVDEMAELAFDDQCTAASPRYPLISDLAQIYKDAWEPFTYSIINPRNGKKIKSCP